MCVSRDCCTRHIHIHYQAAFFLVLARLIIVHTLLPRLRMLPHNNHYNMQECATRVEVQDNKPWLHTT